MPRLLGLILAIAIFAAVGIKLLQQPAPDSTTSAFETQSSALQGATTSPTTLPSANSNTVTVNTPAKNDEYLMNSLNQAAARCGWQQKVSAEAILTELEPMLTLDQSIAFNFLSPSFRVRAEKAMNENQERWQARSFIVDTDGFPTLKEQKEFKNYEDLMTWTQKQNNQAPWVETQGFWQVSLRDFQVLVEKRNSVFKDLQIISGNQSIGCDATQACECLSAR